MLWLKAPCHSLQMVFTFSSDIWQADTQDLQDSNSAGQPALAAPLGAGAAATDPPHEAASPLIAQTLPVHPAQHAADPQPQGSQEAASAAATSAGAHWPPVPIAAAAQRPHTGSQQVPACPGSRQVALGLHTPGSFTRVVPIQECQLQTDESNAILRAVAAAAQQAGLSPWNPATQQGQLRQCTMRSNARGEHFVHLSSAQQVSWSLQAGGPEHARPGSLTSLAWPCSMLMTGMCRLSTCMPSHNNLFSISCPVLHGLLHQCLAVCRSRCKLL